jgi:hypothetical protein
MWSEFSFASSQHEQTIIILEYQYSNVEFSGTVSFHPYKRPLKITVVCFNKKHWYKTNYGDEIIMIQMV